MREDARSGAGGKARLLMGRQVERNLTKKVMAAFEGRCKEWSRRENPTAHGAAGRKEFNKKSDGRVLEK